MTNELVQELRRASKLFSDDGWWKPEILSEAADEIERLRAALAAKTVASVEIRAHDGTLLHGWGSQPAHEPEKQA